MPIMSLSDGDRDNDYHKYVQKDKLIGLVKTRPVLWDKTLEIYKDKDEKATAWNEVCSILMDKYEELNSVEKYEFKKYVVKIWGHTRDSWIRSLKQRNKKSCYSTKYKYHNQILFLRKVVLKGVKDYHSVNLSPESKQELLYESQENRETAYYSRSKDKPNTKYKEQTTSIKDTTKRKTKNEDIIKSCLTCQNSLTEDRNLTFFKSLLPSLVLLDDDQTLEFHAGVLSLLQNIKRRPPYQELNFESRGTFSKTRQGRPSPSPSFMSEQSQGSNNDDPLHNMKMES